ncbi:NusA-like transcription termination signal-binding factor [Candidatus Bathyarchaeota archaeon]|nr:MAG: NusA-like transcription termination signal-binding factor [Candidatus Bathyarchaeota archaeon]
MLQPKIKLTSEEMKYMALFESITGATTQDCVIDEKLGRIIFVAKQGDMGLAIGKGGKNINTLRRMTSRQIEVVEYAERTIDKTRLLVKRYFDIDHVVVS